MAAVTNYHKFGGLKQNEFIFSQSWRPEVQNQGVIRAGFSPKALRKDPSVLA